MTESIEEYDSHVFWLIFTKIRHHKDDTPSDTNSLKLEDGLVSS